MRKIKYKVSCTFIGKGKRVWTKRFWSKRDMKDYVEMITPHTKTLTVKVR